MGLFDKLFSKDKSDSDVAVETRPCAHGVIVPRWDSVDDIGKDELATSYFCEACHETFSPAEAQVLRDSMAERLPVGDN